MNVNKKYGIVIVDMQINVENVADEEVPVVGEAQQLVISSLNGSVVFLEMPFTKRNRETYPALTDMVKPARPVIIPKTKFSGFNGTQHHGNQYVHEDRQTKVSLDYHLRNTVDTNELVVGGRNAHVCVAETIASALELGYIVHTSPDLMLPRVHPDRRYYDLKFPLSPIQNLRWYQSAQNLVEALT